VRKDNVTIYDIAKIAGVSVSTVSRVLNGKSIVNEQTRQKVLSVMEAHNFQPNRLAQSLLRKETMTLGCILPDITNSFFSTVFLMAEMYAVELGYTLLLCNSLNNRQMETQYLKTLSERRVDGIIFLGGRINDSQPEPGHILEMRAVVERIPVVMINGSMPDVDGYVVKADERQGIIDLVRYLYNIGHRKIALVGGILGITSTDIKIAAFREATAALGLAYTPNWIIPTSFSLDSGMEAMQKLLQQSELPTAVLAINDLVAIGAIKEAQRHGLRVPDDISVTGFDDTVLASICTPTLTTVNQNYAALGRTAVDVLVSAATGQKADGMSIVETSLTIRDSCRAIN
jgi:LacI family transcriptional regulator/LacI family purine nucleotide synthesis repressor/LacI family repressor for deo operon, udp, cdd, tsx, nupC, and nupG